MITRDCLRLGERVRERDINHASRGVYEGLGGQLLSSSGNFFWFFFGFFCFFFGIFGKKAFDEGGGVCGWSLRKVKRRMLLERWGGVVDARRGWHEA